MQLTTIDFLWFQNKSTDLIIEKNDPENAGALLMFLPFSRNLKASFYNPRILNMQKLPKKSQILCQLLFLYFLLSSHSQKDIFKWDSSRIQRFRNDS